MLDIKEAITDVIFELIILRSDVQKEEKVFILEKSQLKLKYAI